jgi:hypothetical protein
MSAIKPAATQPSTKLAAIVFLLALALLSPLTASADSLSAHDVLVDSVDYPMPSADRPAVHTGGPISIAVKALLERLVPGRGSRDSEAKRFNYDIDTLGMGMAVRLRFQF